MKKAIKLPVLHKNRNELHALYVERLTSNVQKERQDSFKRLIEALEPCKREEVDCIEQVMSETNFENLLENASAYFEAEMPLHSNTLKIQKLPSIFEDCLTLYLTAVSFMSPPHQMHFYSNMSRLLAKKGYYYQDAPIKNTGHPIDALDYGLLALPYDSPDLLPYYQAGVAQITAEYYYHQGAALLQSTKLAIQSCHFKQDAKDTDIEIAIELFLKQFSLLLKVVKKYAEYPLAEMCALEQQCCDCLNSPELLEGLKKSFRFKLKYCKSDSELLKNTCEPFWVLLGAWGQYALSNAKTALHEFNKCLNAKLSQNPFSALAKEKTNELLLQLEKNELALVLAPVIEVDIKQLIQETRERFAKILNVGPSLNTLPITVLQKRISDEAMLILNALFSAIEYNLGSAPCAFSILGLGSYSREEMSLCSDIDFAILISDESQREHAYFKHFLWMLVHLRRGLPLNVLTIESKDLQTLFGKEKGLMQTPQKMALEHCPLYNSIELKNQKNRLSNTESYSVRRARLIFYSQTEAEESKALCEDYQQLLTKQLESLDETSIPYYQMVGQACLEEDFKKQDGSELGSASLSCKKVVAINLKKTHLRPLTLWILDVGTYFGIEENNTWKILKILKEQSRIAPVFLQELDEALTYLHTLRLKLHHVWLTHPRPVELPFDTWLEMPTAGSAFARHFYLDAAQRETLDAIQRQIIEPLTETISAFGTVLPSPNFDPATQYFEEQFQALGAFKTVDKKEMVDSRLKILSTLAEVALTRPHLLTPSPLFRDLLPKLKMDYLDALETALEALKAFGSTKEIAELKILVQALWHYPTEDGWRAESYRLERAWNQQLMSLVSAEVSFPASKTITLVKDNTLKHYVLKPKIFSQFLTKKGEWRPKGKEITGNHLVYRITNKTQTETLCWAKIYPEQPGIEWLMLHLDQRLGVYGIPCSTLISLHHNGQNTAVLLSAHVPHLNLLETLKTTPQTLSHLDRAHFFKTLMRVLLSNPEDDKGDDYFLEPGEDGLKLIRIDNERAFFAPESVQGFWKVRKLQVKSIIYCLDLLTKPLEVGTSSVDAAIKDFLQLKPYALLKNLLLELKALQPLWQTLFSEEDIKVHYENQNPWLSLPILYVPQELAKELSVRMESLQTLLVLTPKTTGLELLNAVQPKLAKHYQQGFSQYQSQNSCSTVLARFSASPGQHYTVQGDNTVSLDGTQAATLSLRLTASLSLDTVKAIWRGTIYAADAVLKEIECWEANRMTKIYNGLMNTDITIQTKAQAGWQQLPNRQRVLLFNKFSDWVRKNSVVNVPLQQTILGMLPDTTFHQLDLSAFYASLDDRLLTQILKTGGDYLTDLTLSDCQNLSEAIPNVIAQNCPNLKTLNICNMAWKSFSTGLRGWSPILLPTVEKLDMQESQTLAYFIVEAPRADINLQGCMALKHIQFSPDLSFIEAKQSKPGKYQCQLAKAYLLGTDVLRNPRQAYYWARLSRGHQYPLSAILCYALFNFYDVTPLDGSEESLAAKKATVSLVGKQLIQTLKRADMKTLQLSHNNLGTPELTLLSLVLGGSSALQHLNLQGTNIGDKGAELLGLALKENRTLQHLVLADSNINIGAKGTEVLSEALKVNSTLRHLDLEGNNIGAKGAEALSEALKVNSTLQHLTLKYSNIGAKGAELFGEALKANSGLQHLNLWGNNIGAKGAEALGEALKGNSTLKHLNLGSNNIGVKGAEALGEALKANSALQDLNLEYSNLSGSGYLIIVDQIKKSLNKNKQNTQKQTLIRQPLVRTKPLEKKDGSVFPVPLVCQYQQTVTDRELSISSRYQSDGSTEQCQTSLFNEQMDTVSAGWVNPVVFSQIRNANAGSRTSAAPAEEKQPCVLRERTKLVFKTNTGNGF